MRQHTLTQTRFWSTENGYKVARASVQQEDFLGHCRTYHTAVLDIHDMGPTHLCDNWTGKIEDGTEGGRGGREGGGRPTFSMQSMTILRYCSFSSLRSSTMRLAISAAPTLLAISTVVSTSWGAGQEGE